MEQPSILIVEDEESILLALKDDLELEGYRITTAADGLKGLSLAMAEPYDLIILDIMLPKMDGLEVCKQVRQSGKTTPILMLTAKSQEIDKILGLELGGDDYVTKPFSPRELLARVRAILRRKRLMADDDEIYSFGEITVNFRKYELLKKGKPVHFTALEFALLHLFVKNKDRVLSRDEILNNVWGEDIFVGPRTVDTHVANLRRKLEEDSASPKYFLGVRGVGYKFTS